MNDYVCPFCSGLVGAGARDCPQLPAPLREALDAPFNTELGGNKIALYLKDMNDGGVDTVADRARAMVAALRWVIGPWEPGPWDELSGSPIERVIAALEQGRTMPANLPPALAALVEPCPGYGVTEYPCPVCVTNRAIVATLRAVAEYGRTTKLTYGMFTEWADTIEGGTK